MDKSMLGLKLKALRIRIDLKQEDIAQLIGLDRSAYSCYERGKTFPKLQTLEKLAVIFGVDVNYLLDDSLQVASENAVYSVEDSPIDDTFNDLSKPEKMIVLKYRLMNKNDKQKLLEMLESDK